MSATKFRFLLAGLILLAVTANAAVAYFGIDYLQQQVAAGDKLKIEAELNNQAGLDVKRAVRQFDDERVAKLDGYLKDIIPDTAYREQFIADVNTYAKESGLKLSSITYVPDGQTPPVKGATTVPISLTISGEVPYTDFIRFVKKIENNLQHVQVLTLNMSPSAENRSVLGAPGLTVALYVEGGN